MASSFHLMFYLIVVCLPMKKVNILLTNIGIDKKEKKDECRVGTVALDKSTEVFLPRSPSALVSMEVEVNLIHRTTAHPDIAQ